MNMQIAALAAVLAVLIVVPNVQSIDFSGNPDGAAQVVQYERSNSGENGYQYSYQTSNGISGQEQGNFQSAGNEEGDAVIQGQYAYTAPDGKQIVVGYTADKNGFHPKTN